MYESNPSLEIVEVRNSDSALWDRFVEESPQGNLFHTTTWADILSSTFGRSYTIVFCKKNDQTVGGMIYFKHKKLSWDMITPMAFFPYSAPLFYNPVDEKPQKTIHNLLSITASFDNYLRKNFDYWILDVPSESNDVRSYLWQGAIIEPQYSYIVSISNKEELYENYNQSVRKKLKQAQKQHAKIIESDDPVHLAELVIESYQRHGMKPHVSEDHLKIFLGKLKLTG